MPYTSSVTSFENTFEKIFKLNLSPETIAYFKKKYELKEKWAFCFKKVLPCLKINTTSRIEGLNSLIKANINLSTRLTELIHFMLKMHKDIMNKPFSAGNKVSAELLQDLEKLELLQPFKTILSQFAFEEIARNFLYSWSIEMSEQRGFFIFKQKENPEYEFKVKKPSGLRAKALAECDCSYFKTMGLPCSHLFAIAQKNKNGVSLESTIRKRWLKKDSFEKFEDSKLIEAIDVFLKGKLNKSTSFFFSYIIC